jgi:cytochrome c peroxidase
MGFLLCLSLISAFAQSPNELDLKLQEYVKTFSLKPLSNLPAKNENLFELGKQLFMERKISGNENISCMDCHHPSIGSGDGLVLGLGEGAEGLEIKAGSRVQKTGTMLARNTPPLFNLGGIEIPYFWDGRVRFAPVNKIFITPDADLNGATPVRSDITTTMKSGLAAQAIFPMVNHAEMRGKPGTNPIADAKSNSEAWDLIVEKILKDEHYKKQFEKVFPGEKINIGHFGEAIAHLI